MFAKSPRRSQFLMIKVKSLKVPNPDSVRGKKSSVKNKFDRFINIFFYRLVFTISESSEY